MNPLLSIKDLFGAKATAKENYCVLDKSLKEPNSNNKESDFGKILKQRDPQEKPTKRPEKFSQSDENSEEQEAVSEYSEANTSREPIQEIEVSGISLEETFTIPHEMVPMAEEDRWSVGTEVLLNVQQSEDFSTDEVPLAEDKSVKDSADVLEQSCISVPIIAPEQTLKPTEKIHQEVDEMSENLQNVTTEKTDMLVVKPKTENFETENVTNSEKVVKDAIPLPLESENENVKTSPKIVKPVAVSPKNGMKAPNAIRLSNVSSFETPQNSSNFLNIQHFDGWNNIGIKSAPKGGERKGGFVSPHSTVLTESEGPLHRDLAISSNGSRVAEVLSQKTDGAFVNDLEQNFEGKEVVLPQVQPKVAVNTYETVRQEHAETVQGMIATLEQQMDEMKRTRRNSVIVKVDLENGESLNCQVTLARSDVAIRFPALEENFKMQILNHWESLRKFAQTRQLNLSEPHFIAQTSL